MPKPTIPTRSGVTTPTTVTGDEPVVDGLEVAEVTEVDEPEVDLDALADTTYLAQGNQYPQSQASKDNQARAARAEADALQAMADEASAVADELEEKAKQ